MDPFLNFGITLNLVELRKEYEIKTRTPGLDSSLGLVLESQLQAS